MHCYPTVRTMSAHLQLSERVSRTRCVMTIICQTSTHTHTHTTQTYTHAYIHTHTMQNTQSSEQPYHFDSQAHSVWRRSNSIHTNTFRGLSCSCSDTQLHTSRQHMIDDTVMHDAEQSTHQVTPNTCMHTQSSSTDTHTHLHRYTNQTAIDLNNSPPAHWSSTSTLSRSHHTE